MNFRNAILPAGLTFLLAACNFTLAADVTPPPGYVPPTPMPTLGPLYPAGAPDIVNGASIYFDKCAPCHGETGLGDGEQGKELPVTVPAFALPQTAHKASPAAWFTMVSRGNLDRFMPPFTSLNEQERWDVVAYALTLHTTPEQIATGKALFDAQCLECHADGFSQELMAGKSAENIAFLISNGHNDVPPMDMTEDEAYAAAAYLRSGTFAILSAPTPMETVGATFTPQVEGTPAEVTPEATFIPGVGNVSGSIDNRSGQTLPSDLKVTLRGLDHGADPNRGPQEVSRHEAPLNPDGSYIFENVELPENLIFIAELEIQGITYQSEFVIVESGTTDLALAPIQVYGLTEDPSILRVDALQMFFDFANEQSVQILAVYSLTNSSEKTLTVRLGEQEEIPFIKTPKGTQNIGYEAASDGAPFVPLADGFAIPPNQVPYSLIAFASLAKDETLLIEQPIALPVEEVVIIVPEGVTARGETLTDEGLQSMPGGNFYVYRSGSIKAGGELSFTLSGKPISTSVSPDLTQNSSLLIGVGGLGLVLILVGAWLFLRDRRRSEQQEDEAESFEEPDAVIDAIIALDDLHRAGKLSDKVYKQRREELKDSLRKRTG
ncbi:MAG: cytochrome c [Chloroflexi bacterium]|nr:cytochrome c [Chloroflexota bacterium]